MTDIVTSLTDALPVFDQQVDKAFQLTDTGELLWRHGETWHTIAHLKKAEQIYTPQITLVSLDAVPTDQKDIIQARLTKWLSDYTQKHLGTLLTLENATLTEKPKPLAHALVKQMGVIFRKDYSNQIKELSKEERHELTQLGVRIGAFYIYHRDILKPGAIYLKSILWRLSQGKEKDVMKLPQDGNVSMSAPSNADKDFYHAMALPVYQSSCVRIDMIERLNSAIFDQAVEGKYKFDPALASTLGVSVDTLYMLLEQLGFPFEETAIDEKMVRYYTLNRRKPEIKPKREKQEKQAFKKTVQKNRKPKSPTESQKPSAIRGYSAFASLQSLKDRQSE